jgi:hypothetical protein
MAQTRPSGLNSGRLRNEKYSGLAGVASATMKFAGDVFVAGLIAALHFLLFAIFGDVNVMLPVRTERSHIAAVERKLFLAIHDHPAVFVVGTDFFDVLPRQFAAVHESVQLRLVLFRQGTAILVTEGVMMAVRTQIGVDTEDIEIFGDGKPDFLHSRTKWFG